MSIPDSKQLREWRRLAENTEMISAVGEYTPAEFITLLDAVESLQEDNARYEKALRDVLAGHWSMTDLQELLGDI